MAAPEAIKLRRFTITQRLFHLGLIIVFMLLSITGFVWMYIETDFGRWLASLFGGYTNALQVHRIVGLVMIAGFAVQAVYLLFSIDWRGLPRALFGGDSLVWRWLDFKQFFQHASWVLGLAPEPSFERWSWWEKFDYWAIWWGLVIVGVTGLMLYDPILSSDYLPGWMFNVALWVHRIEALLAIGHVFTVHFFIEHFRPRNFPFSASMFDGGLTLEHAHSEHPAWVARLERDGTLDARLFPMPPLPIRLVNFVFGYAMILLGLYLLVFAIINLFALTLC